jgi:hypothetical protein
VSPSRDRNPGNYTNRDGSQIILHRELGIAQQGGNLLLKRSLHISKGYERMAEKSLFSYNINLTPSTPMFPNHPVDIKMTAAA